MSRSTLKTSAINAEIRKAQAAAAAPAAPAGKKGVAKDKPAAAAPKGAGEVRIIGGAWKRTRLPVAQRPGLRHRGHQIGGADPHHAALHDRMIDAEHFGKARPDHARLSCPF